MTTIKNLCVAARKYQSKDGQEKTQWVIIGKQIEIDQGGKFLVLDPWINLSGFPVSEKGGVMVSIFEQKDGDQTQSKNNYSDAKSSKASSVNADPMDDIPF